MLRVNEIYPAICGESRFSGTPCTLVRLTGCHVRCAWCDSSHAFQGGGDLPVAEVLDRVREIGLTTVLVTGGEPLLQRPVVDLMRQLLADGRTVLLETSGTKGPENLVPLAEVPAGVHRVVDVKAPGSGIPSELIDWEGIAGLGVGDEIKIVCADRGDYQWARDLVAAGVRLPAAAAVSLSPVQGQLAPSRLAEWILADRLEVHFQIQLHKAVWPERDKGV